MNGRHLWRGYQASERQDRNPHIHSLPYLYEREDTGMCYDQRVPWWGAQWVRLLSTDVPGLELWLVKHHRRQPVYVSFNRRLGTFRAIPRPRLPS